jgi:two-component system phosphate regulon sensor histidine kinase PhoR
MSAVRSAARPRTLAGRLLLWHVVAVLAVLLALGVVIDRVLERYFVDQLTETLVSEGRAVQEVIAGSTSPFQAEAVRLGGALGARITVIRTDGVVLADSDHDPATMENHRGRPEVQAALRGRTGVADRPSATLGEPFRYVALPASGGRIVRMALPLTTVQSKLTTVRVILGIGLGAAALAGLIALSLIGRGVSRPLRQAAAAVDRVAEGDLSVDVPEAGTRELAGLAKAVNRMRAEVGTRIGELERERTLRDSVLSRLDEGVVLFAGDGTVEYLNRTARRLLGSIERVSHVIPIGLRDAIEGVRRERDRQSLEVTGPGSRILAADALSIPGAGEVLLVVRDVTQARALDAVRRDFVANASHELKTPAASIRALAETIETAAAEDPGSVPHFASQLEREAVRLSRIISDLLDLSRLEGEIGERAAVRVDQLVMGEVRRMAEASANAISVSAESPVVVTGSARDITLLIRNLVENAVQYSRPGGEINVDVHPEDGSAVLSVQDSGVGIPQKDQARVFERFYRVDRARSRETGGTGLGLSIVKHVAENHGATVDVQSRLGEGSTFTVRFPLRAESVAG